MQRKRYSPGRVPGTLLGLGAGLGVALGALTGCSAAGTAEDVTVDAKAGSAAAPVAPPGRYRTLFEPCGAVPQTALRELLPGTVALSDVERAKALRGTAAVTYDTDRRVGCTWTADTVDGGSHRLVLDVERVVSYDPTVSDATRAQEVYTRKQLAAGIAVPVAPTPTPTAPATGPTTAPTSGTTASGTAGTSGAATTAPPTITASATPTGAASSAATGATASGAPSAPATTGLEPRLLGGLGDIAFVGDTLGPAGGAGRQRVVSVVFRTSNVVVTVEYRQRTTGTAPAPDSKELQDRAQNLARLLADRLEE
ncbi:DUF3558 domain-containing protein [Streptomyces roseolus]|uniref:DUF3558 domain-containing protein n=1 Tax=Streptomyces roseolus TaxID=67358 RepID=UPI0019CCBF10|nr:DUF3558 domain-containing protein [Streptomyces roseolus]GGR54607.1 hypothetical protein GCM10010282_54560 [Streptomyces roseolus]